VRNRGVLLLALLIAAVLAAGSAFALINAGDDSGPKVDALPTASPTPTATETPSATPTATPTESATPEPTATATTSPTAKPTASATSKPTSSGTYSYPKPSHSYQGLELTLSSPDNNQPAGEDFVLTVKSSDGDGKIFFNGLSWGDGQSEPAAANPQHCKSYPQPPTSPQGAYQPQPDSKTFTFHHKYLVGGRDYVIAVKVASVNGDCRPNGPKREDTKLYLRIHVDPAA
jgi:hypothetical protein